MKQEKFKVVDCIRQFIKSLSFNLDSFPKKEYELKERIKEKASLEIIYKIIDSNNPGLFIGSMTSQILSIFYLNDMDHFIKETLK